MRRPVVLTLVVLCLVAGGLGLSLGLRVAGVDETALIEEVAADWAAGGGDVTSCVARPGTGRIRLVVTCGTGEDALVRGFDRFGLPARLSAGPGT